MNSLEMFSNLTYLAVTVFSFVFFIFCAVYVSLSAARSVISQNAVYIALAFVAEMANVWYLSGINEYALHFSVNILVGIQLLISLNVLILLGIPATTILFGVKARLGYALSAAVAGGACIIWFALVSSDGYMSGLLNNIFLTIGYAYLAAGYLSQCFKRNNTSYVIGFIAVAFVGAAIGLRVVSPDDWLASSWYLAPIAYLGLGISFLISTSDVLADELRQLQHQLFKNNLRFKEIIKSSPFPIVIARLSDDKILLANENAQKLFGIAEQEVEKFHLKDFFVDSDNRKLLNSHLEKGRLVKDFEILVKACENETPFWLLTSANIVDYGQDVALYAAFQDITDRKKREDILQTQATRDPLTSLYNRRYFEEEVNRRIALGVNKNYSVFMIDADHFKRVNDTYGHKVGDRVLMALASTAEKALRENDIVARYGGEEFVVYLADTVAEDALVVADRLREAVSRIVVRSDADEPVTFTVSIGISSSSVSQDVNALVKMADDALYKAKESGRNRCMVYSEDIQTRPVGLNDKQEENVHPAYAGDNNREFSLLSGKNTETEN